MVKAAISTKQIDKDVILLIVIGIQAIIYKLLPIDQQELKHQLITKPSMVN